LANNPTWADQVEISKSQKLALSYTFPKIRKSNFANKIIAKDLISKPHSDGTIDMSIYQGLELAMILYSVN